MICYLHQTAGRVLAADPDVSRQRGKADRRHLRRAFRAVGPIDDGQDHRLLALGQPRAHERPQIRVTRVPVDVAPVHRVDRSADLKQVLEDAFNEDGPSLIVLPIDYNENRKLTEKLGQITCPI